MFFVTVNLKNSEIPQENIGDEDLQVLRKSLLLEIYNKFIFLINTTEWDNMLISYSNCWTFNIFILPE